MKVMNTILLFFVTIFLIIFFVRSQLEYGPLLTWILGVGLVLFLLVYSLKKNRFSK